MRGDAIAGLLVLWALSRAERAEAKPAPPPAPPAPAPPAPAPPSQLPPIDARSPGIPQRARRVPWSMETMRLFVSEMKQTPVDPVIVLRGIAAVSDFDPGFFLGKHQGLLGIPEEKLLQVGYPANITAAQYLPADEQFPLIRRVINWELAGNKPAPKDVGDLAVLIVSPKKGMESIIRGEVTRRAQAAEATRYYQQHAALLQRALQE